MITHRTTAAAYRLLHNGALALAKVEAAGIRVDKGYLDSAMANTEARIADMEQRLQSSKVWSVWERHYGKKAKLTKREQLAKVVFDLLGYESKVKTAKSKKDSTTEEAFEDLDIPFVNLYLETERWRKAYSTFLVGLRREVIERDGSWYVHPFFNLNTVISYRSSSSWPNFQNQPNRVPEIADLIRHCYIAREGNYFVEIDYGQLEVRIAAVYNRDPNLMAYCFDDSKDMHRDTAQELFFLEPAQAKRKGVRHLAKNGFVFPEFYGAIWMKVARDVWREMIARKLTAGEGGIPLVDHLAKHGIRELGTYDEKTKETRPGTFYHHVKSVEDSFWLRRFKVYTDWKERWYNAYLRDGGYSMKTGFAVNGVHKRTEVLNYAVQGSAAHCLLWSLIRLTELFKKYNLKSKIIGEIHDSIQLDVPPSEIQVVLDLCRQVMIDDLMKEWKWIDVPLTVEAEVSPLGKSWYEKGVWTRGDREWAPKA